jgi:RNA polymerase sigma-54 factor
MLKQSLQQKLLQKMSPQQIQLMKLLQVPTVELEQRIKEEMEENPALEEGREDEEDFLPADVEEDYGNDGEDISEAQKEFDFSEYLDDDTPDYKLSVNNYSADDDEYETPIGAGTTFAEELKEQLSLRNVTEHQKMLAETVIGNLDESGYLQRDIRSMVNDLAFTQNIMTTTEELEEVLAIVQDLDPAGIGARNLQECLLLQIRRIEHRDYIIELAERILTVCFDEFTKKHYERIAKKLGIEEEEDLKEAIAEIVRLNPKPGGSTRENVAKTQQIVPDFLMSVEGDKIIVTLNQRNAPDLKISREYKDMMETYMQTKPDKKQREAMSFVKSKIDSAKWFIDAIKQRQNTLMLVINAIIEYQREYFLTGDPTKMKPMILKDIADIVMMDISTVSRVANSKYLQTPYGTTLLKPYFSESLSTDSGEEVSTIEVKNILREAIEGEDKRKPLPDDRLMAILNAKGYNIARRTVAKYREQLGIPVARLRKEL